MFPALRAGYLIVPPPLVDAFGAAVRLTGQQVPAADQAALADFITEGHFAAHVRRMRALYATRRAHLVASLRRRGLHLGYASVREPEMGPQVERLARSLETIVHRRGRRV